MNEDTSIPDGLSFDLVTTTLGRVEELSRFLESLAAQTHRSFRLIIVDQNSEGRIDDIVTANWGFPIMRLRSPVGISTGRYTVSSSWSTLICVHTPALPARSAESCSQVS